MQKTTKTMLLSCCYDGPLSVRLQLAEKLYAERAQELLRESTITQGLTLLAQYSQALSAQMQIANMGRLCTACASRPQGGCCSAEMAANCDSILLLMNRLLGVSLRQQQEDAASCCFLGPQGCIFFAKPTFCLSYNCIHILNSLNPKDLDQLCLLAGQMLRQQNHIENTLIELLFSQQNMG